MSGETEFTMEFRAAAFYRILGNLQTIHQKDGEDLLNTLLKMKDIAPYQEELAGMIMEMNCRGAMAIFPTDNLTELADMVLYIARYYYLHPEAAAKISTICGIPKAGSTIVGDGHTCPLLSGSSNGRIQEIASLNNNFHQLSQIIGKNNDVKINVEFFEVENTIFHPESQYLRVIVTTS